MEIKQLYLNLQGFESLKETMKAMQMVAASDFRELDYELEERYEFFSVYNIVFVHTGIFTKTRRNYSTNMFRSKRYYVKFPNIVSPKVKISMTTPKIIPSMKLEDAKSYLSDMKTQYKLAKQYRKDLCSAADDAAFSSHKFSHAKYVEYKALSALSNAKYEYSKALNPLSDAQISYVNYIGDTIMAYKRSGYPLPLELMLHIRYIFSFQTEGSMSRNPWYIQDHIIKKDILSPSKFWLDNSNLFAASKCRDILLNKKNASINSNEILHHLHVLKNFILLNGNVPFYAGKDLCKQVDLCISEIPFSSSDYHTLDSGIKALKKSCNLGKVHLFQHKNFSTPTLHNIKDKSRDCLNEIKRGEDYYSINLVSRAENLKDSTGYENWINSTYRDNEILPILISNSLTYKENLDMFEQIEKNTSIGVICVNSKRTKLFFKEGSMYEPVDSRVNAKNWYTDIYLTEISKDLNTKFSMCDGSTDIDMWETLDYMLDILESVIWKLF